MAKKIKIGILGNPNSGKTSLFNALVGAKQHVGNWPGVTVEQKTGSYQHGKSNIHVVDLPGIYSLLTSSLDEKVARDFILKESPDVVINIADASSLERHLYLTVQLLEMRIPCVLVLNMMDRARQKKIQINIEELSRALGCPVVGTVASRGEGINALKNAIAASADKKEVSSVNIYFPQEAEDTLQKIILYIKNKKEFSFYDPRWMAIKILEGDALGKKFQGEGSLEEIIALGRKRIKEIIGEDVDVVIADSRYGFVHSVCKKTIQRSDSFRRDISDAVDKVVLNRFLGIPFFLLTMYLMFWVTINLGGCFIDFFEILFGAIFVDGTRNLLTVVGAPQLLITFFANGIGGGLQTVSTFIPPIFFIFFCMAILEDSGYMARAAFVADGLMRSVGLPGKAFVPMLIGFGCNVPAIMATRTLENARDRALAVMMNPFMSCAARLPVYALFAAAFFPKIGGIVIFSLYLIGIFFGIMTAFLLKNTALKGQPSSFIFELPPYHLPTLKGILIHTWGRLKGFIIKAGRAILLVIVILNMFGFAQDVRSPRKQPEDLFLGKIARPVTVLFAPMGIQEENWPAVVGIFTGIFAKESVIGTLDSLYGNLDSDQVTDEKKENFSGKVSLAFESIFRNLKEITWPFSFSKQAPGSPEISRSLKNSMTKRFDGQKGAFAYLLFILLYIPCIATAGAIYQELNLRWMAFSVIYSLFLAWSAATVFYQVMTFVSHPLASLRYIVSIAVAFVGVYFFLKRQKRFLCL
ncbi:MAG: Fe(2+) transporter permease subunit FeoB [Candidatus Aceula meridiana]|nr:Fe(2+) transporter permease subunit FeoB [Candidatus Aceula meridiana]